VRRAFVLAGKRGGRRHRHRASRVRAGRKEGRSPSSCVARSSTIHRRCDASTVHRVLRPLDGRIGSWRRRFWFLLLLVVVVRWMGEAEDHGVIGIARVRNDEGVGGGGRRRRRRLRRPHKEGG
jgi:hypothetical protein